MIDASPFGAKHAEQYEQRAEPGPARARVETE
jgi:hypothetical protein